MPKDRSSSGRVVCCRWPQRWPLRRRRSAETVLKVSLHSDLKIIDPIWTTALISAHHGNMVYDTLFALDDKLVVQAADGRQVGGLARQAHLDLHPARRARMARRPAGDGRRLRRLDQALGRQGFDGPEADGRRRRALRARRQDDQDGAEGALRPGAEFARQGGGERRLHDAQARRRDRSQHPDHRRHRLGPVHLQEGRMEGRREGGLRRNPSTSRATSRPRARRRQDRQGRPGRMDHHPRPADPGERADRRRDRPDRDRRPPTCCRWWRRTRTSRS